MTGSSTHTGRDAELLKIWERTASVAPAWRDDAMLGAAAPLSLGARNAALLALRARLLGPRQPLVGECPKCGTAVEFAVDCDALAAGLLPADDAAQAQRLDAHGYVIEFRLPDAEDLRALVAGPDFVRATLARCVLRCSREGGTSCAPDSLPAEVTLALSHRMETLEPGASVGFELACPECGACWSTMMDVGAVVWAEVRSRAERVLLDVDALARAYGWSEAEVLALSPTRRAAYLQLAGAA